MLLNLQDELYNKYPKLLNKEIWCDNINCGDGWYNIIDQVCARIDHYLKYKQDVQVEFVQIKEKFGMLRMYFIGGDQYVHGVVDFAENISGVICEVCGKPGIKIYNGWIKTRCSKHRNNKSNYKRKGSISVDFDGVINSYRSGFVAIDKIPDSPVEGAFEFLEELLNFGFKVYIYSTRNSNTKGRMAIMDWMLKYGLNQDIIDKLKFPVEKPIAKVYIDDRAWEFTGTWPKMDELENFVPWHGGQSSSQK